MSKETGYVARGFRGLKNRPQMEKDILALRDKAKRRRRRKDKLEASVADNQKRIKRGKKSRTISERDIEKGMNRFRSSAQKLRRRQGRAALLRAKAKKVGKAGHKKAAATYRQAAKELLARK